MIKTIVSIMFSIFKGALSISFAVNSVQNQIIAVILGVPIVVVVIGRTICRLVRFIRKKN